MDIIIALIFFAIFLVAVLFVCVTIYKNEIKRIDAQEAAFDSAARNVFGNLPNETHNKK